MKPAIYEVTTPQGRMAWLVDELSSGIANDENGKPRQHFAAAIELGVLRAGELKANIDPATGVRIIHGPRCCVVALVKTKVENSIQSRGFDPKAAEVLLELSAAHNDVTFRPARMSFEFSTPAEKGVSQPWDEVKFLAAWRWSYWQRESLTGAQRHADMVALGYTGTEGALRQMLKRMGLAKPQSRPGKAPLR
jgi:hypothetical protein